MKLHRFYIPQEHLSEYPDLAPEQVLTVHSSSLTHQMKNVLRLLKGEKIIFFNGNGKEYLSTIVSYEGKDIVHLKIEETAKNDISFSKEIHLFFSLIKKDNIDWILEKGTEIGVSHFIPVISARSEKKDINMERANKIVIEATEQCGRNIPPIIHPVAHIEDVFDDVTMSFIILEKHFPVLNREEVSDKRIGLLIGPEGGWTKEEMTMFENKKATFRSLGPTILRAETAAIIASSRFFL